MPGFKYKDHILPIIPRDCLNCTIILTSPKGRQRRTSHSLSMVREGGRQEKLGLGAQPLLPTTKVEKQIPCSIFPVFIKLPLPPGTASPKVAELVPAYSGPVQGPRKPPPLLPSTSLPSLTLPGIPPLVSWRCGNSRQHSHCQAGVINLQLHKEQPCVPAPGLPTSTQKLCLRPTEENGHGGTDTWEQLQG